MSRVAERIRRDARDQAYASTSAWAEGIEIDTIIAHLEDAGRTLSAMYIRDPRPSERVTAFPEILRERSKMDYADGSATNRPSMPSARDIDKMDDVLDWIKLIPADKFVIRRIVHARCLVHPITDRHRYSWNRIADLIGSHERSVRFWHAQGVLLIIKGLLAIKVL